jgi:hypothetical protein
MTSAAKLTDAHIRFMETIADSVIDRVMPKQRRSGPRPIRPTPEAILDGVALAGRLGLMRSSSNCV